LVLWGYYSVELSHGHLRLLKNSILNSKKEGLRAWKGEVIEMSWMDIERTSVNCPLIGGFGGEKTEGFFRKRNSLVISGDSTAIV